MNDDRFEKWKAKNHRAEAYREDIGTLPLKTSSGNELDPVYVPAHTNQSALNAETLPGKPPFTRGLHPDMYRQRFWTFRQYSGFSSAAETNARWKELLRNGSTGLST